MPMRRPIGNLPTDDGAGAMPPHMPMPGAMPPRPGMTGAPANNGMPGGGQPQDGMSGLPMPPPPIQPEAGGPTSPMNIGSMLTPQQSMGMPGGGQPQSPRTPLPPWGEPAGMPQPGGFGVPDGTDGMPGGGSGGGNPHGDVNAGPPGSQGNAYMAQGDSPSHAGSPSMVMIRMLKAMGQL